MSDIGDRFIKARTVAAGEEGQKLEDEIKTIRRQYDKRIIGPNCVGLIIPGVDLNRLSGSQGILQSRGPTPENLQFWFVTNTRGRVWGAN